MLAQTTRPSTPCIIKVEKLDCVEHVQKRMGKHLLNLKARTKGKLADVRYIVNTGRLTDTKIKKLQKDYGLAIQQNTTRKSNPTRGEVEVAVFAMKKLMLKLINNEPTCIFPETPNLADLMTEPQCLQD